MRFPVLVVRPAPASDRDVEARGMGDDGWRLPTRDELLTLVTRRRGPGPRIDASVFLGIGTGGPRYWSSTPFDPRHTDRLWCVDLVGGEATACARESNLVLLVRQKN